MAANRPSTSPVMSSPQRMLVTSKSSECDSNTLPPTPALLMPSEVKKGSPKSVQLPMSRIRTVMKCAPDVNNINQDCVVLMARATELFVEHFARQACNQATKEGRINVGYDDLADAVQTDSFRLRFLNDVVPQKVLAKDALEYYYKKVGQDPSAHRKSQAAKEPGTEEIPTVAPPDTAYQQRLPE